MAGCIVDEDCALEVEHVRELERLSNLRHNDHSKPIFERVERAVHARVEFAREEVAEGEDMYACDSLVFDICLGNLFWENLPRDKVVTGAVRKFQSSIFVISLEHSGQPWWKGFFLLTSMFNFILKEQMFQESS